MQNFRISRLSVKQSVRSVSRAPFRPHHLVSKLMRAQSSLCNHQRRIQGCADSPPPPPGRIPVSAPGTHIIKKLKYIFKAYFFFHEVVKNGVASIPASVLARPCTLYSTILSVSLPPCTIYRSSYGLPIFCHCITV